MKTQHPTIVFLDIDGVLNGGFHDEWGFDWTLPGAVVAFNRIINETGAKVVVSSSWRLDNTLEEIEAFLSSRGVVAEFIDVTPEINFETDWDGDLCMFPDARIKEIRVWLDEHPEAQNFLVLDDQDIRLDVNNTIKTDAKIEARWVKPEHKEGFTEDQATRAINLLRS